MLNLTIDDFKAALIDAIEHNQQADASGDQWDAVERIAAAVLADDRARWLANFKACLGLR